MLVGEYPNTQSVSSRRDKVGSSEIRYQYYKRCSLRAVRAGRIAEFRGITGCPLKPWHSVRKVTDSLNNRRVEPRVLVDGAPN